MKIKSSLILVFFSLFITQTACYTKNSSEKDASIAASTPSIEPSIDTTSDENIATNETSDTEDNSTDTTVTETTSPSTTATDEDVPTTITAVDDPSITTNDDSVTPSAGTSEPLPTTVCSATEVCGDSIDNDCDGSVDNGTPTITYYQDADGDSFGSATAESTSSCAVISGYVTDNSDCDDTNAEVKPGTAFYQDADGDGFGSTTAESTLSCAAISGYVTNSTDCDDTNNALTTINTYYLDFDRDNHGSLTRSITSCYSAEQASTTAGSKYIADSSDCNDYQSQVYDGAPELCDGYDNDCDGAINDGFTIGTFYQDWDEDGYGTPLVSEQTCYNTNGTPRKGYSTDNTDCNDGDWTIPINITTGVTTTCIEDDCTIAGEATCSTYTVPSDIATCDGDADATNDTDVTDELQAWLNTVPDGTESLYSIADLGGKCFATKGDLELLSRHNITIEGSGGTLQAIDYEKCSLCSGTGHGRTYTGTTSAEWDAAYAAAKADPDDASYHGRAIFEIDIGSGFKIQNLTIQGNLARNFDTDGDGDKEDATVEYLYDFAREWDQNLRLMGPKNVTIDNVHFKNAWGDAVMLSGSYKNQLQTKNLWTSEPNDYFGVWAPIQVFATDITIKNSFIDGAGRMAVGCVGCFNFVVQDTDMRNIGYALVDVEIESNDNNSHGDISLIRNTIGAFRFGLLSAATGQASDSTLGPFVLQDNIQEQRSVPVSTIPIFIGHDGVPVSKVEITGNTFSSRSVATFRIEAAEEVIISNNKTYQLNYHAAYLKNVAKAEIYDNTFTGAWGIAWFRDEDNEIIDETTANTTCTNNTMIGVVNNVDFGRWVDEDGNYGVNYPFVISEGCETYDCRDFGYTDC